MPSYWCTLAARQCNWLYPGRKIILATRFDSVTHSGIHLWRSSKWRSTITVLLFSRTCFLTSSKRKIISFYETYKYSIGPCRSRSVSPWQREKETVLQHLLDQQQETRRPNEIVSVGLMVSPGRTGGLAPGNPALIENYQLSLIPLTQCFPPTFHPSQHSAVSWPQ